MATKRTPAEEKAWAQWSKQQHFPFVSPEERVRLAFLAGHQMAREAEDKKAARKAKRSASR